jgi:mono/diheme cytochrome c family protein
MPPRLLFPLCAALLVAALSARAQLTPAELAGAIPVPNLVWDSELKEVTAKSSDPFADFVFNVTNVASVEITIRSLKTSCDCTAAKLPSQPWHLAPGASGQINVRMKLAGKAGTVTKSVTADTSVGPKEVQVRVHLPSLVPGVVGAMTEEQRKQNAQLAAADRQAVFKANCADCHFKPATGKSGAQLFAAVCGICHESKNRASTVPDLRAMKNPTNLDYWRHWIRNGRPGTMMPAFETAQGGPLDELQIMGLAAYLQSEFGPKNAAAPPPAGKN